MEKGGGGVWSPGGEAKGASSGEDFLFGLSVGGEVSFEGVGLGGKGGVVWGTE